MHTAIKKEEEKKEYFDTPQELDQKVSKLAEWIMKSKGTTFFTGAGISTASGIPDYRSGANTVMPTGAGCWEKQAEIAKARKAGTLKFEPSSHEKLRGAILTAVPSKAHMALAKLVEEKKVKDIISQNLDGLHLKSGVPAEKLHEVHGNQNLEKCTLCKKTYLRDFKVARKGKGHETGRFCDDEKCKGPLADTDINFGEALDEQTKVGAWMSIFSGNDLMVCVGSSLRVSPVNKIPYTAAVARQKLVIINLQKTPFTDMADLNIFAKIDDVFELLMAKLGYPIPAYQLERHIEVNVQTDPETKAETYSVKGIDKNLNSFDYLREVKVNGQDSRATIQIEKKYIHDYMADETNFIQIDLHFQGHQKENALSLKVPRWMVKKYRSREGSIMIKMVNDLKNWTEMIPTRCCKYNK